MEIECQRLTDGLQNTPLYRDDQENTQSERWKIYQHFKAAAAGLDGSGAQKTVYAHFFTLWGFGLPTAMAKGQESFIKMLAQKNAVPTVISILQTPRKIKIIDTCTVKLS